MTSSLILPLTPERWSDFEKLFGPRGACGGCWCLYWKLPRKQFSAGQGDVNRQIQKEIVLTGRMPGLLAYQDGIPVGWIAVEPRENYPVLNNSRILQPLDNLPVWSVTCFFVTKQYRNQGLTVALLLGAIRHVSEFGGTIIEGYPVAPGNTEKKPPAFIYSGVLSAFAQAGFKEAGRRSEKRPLMRFYIRD
jgi:GNAT superfamily N-acetyltransferase